MSNKKEGIIVLGMPRSGTTLVRRVLGSHPHICCPSETNLLSHASKFLEEHSFAGGLSVGVVPGLDFSGIPEDQTIARVKTFVTGFFEDIAKANRKERWAEKTAVDIFYIDNIERLFGDCCQFVCLFRHPLDVVCSIRELSDKMEMYLPELHTYIANNLSPLEALANAWAEANDRLLRFIDDHHERAISLKYEDLVADPSEKIRQLFEFLGEPVDERALLKEVFASSQMVGLGDWKTFEADQISSDSVGRHEALDPHVVARLSTIVNSTMTRIGYEPIEIEDLLSDEAARRKFQLSRMVAGMQQKKEV